MEPASLTGYDFLVKFRDSIDQFGDKMTFEPRYKFKDLSEEFEDDFLDGHCYGGGSYCSVANLELDASSVLDEAIRQKCIFKLGSEKKLSKDVWWNYIGNYRNCLKDKLSNKNVKKIDCYEKVAETAKLGEKGKKMVEECYNNSFSSLDNKASSGNSILQADENSYEYSGIYLVPAFFVNGQLVKEDLKLKVVVSAVCDKLINKPDMCQEFLVSNINWEHTIKVNNNNGLITILSIIVFGFVIILFTVVVVKRRMHGSIDGEIRDEIRSHVTEYMKLRDSND